ncbi:alpha/beta hydrolase family protein [Stackebrandtia albiflava]|uniref:Alpha/beta hydrolase family protein n=1 Tax=Stackebrandtia albiflava TaxID=406432 RepID=A0A562VE41_9ACTN|nr:alpha/beta hydrolase [Stackebrandtia albiflava]TWJ16132.1 alpha/beta hydrolase family protein [Stackebrandtia albiflava]
MPHVVSADGTRIGYERLGEGPPVVIVSGAMSLGAAAIPLSEELASRFTVYRYDRRGRGDSGDTSPYSVEAEIADLDAVIAEAGGHAFVHGNSSGAILALRAACAGSAVDRLTLFEPPFVGADPNLVAELSRYLDAGDRAGAVGHFMRSIGVPEEMAAAAHEPGLTAIAHTLIYDLTITGDNDGLVPTERLAGLTVPTMVLDSTGTAPTLREAAEATADAIPGGVHRSLAGGWHGVPDADLADVLVRFFEA